MQPQRDILTTSTHVISAELPMKLRQPYPPPERAMLQRMKLESVIVHYLRDPSKEIILPGSTGSFGRKRPLENYAGMSQDLPEDATVFALILDYLHDPKAFGMEGCAFGLRLRLRYDLAGDRLEGFASSWPAPTPDGVLAPGSPIRAISGVFQLTYLTPY